uniref:Uncharacterized protein n=1 Tax=Heterorhabditis bacteriophora TaxID=37862 RepID=A0A1I7XNY9_HETBA
MACGLALKRPHEYDSYLSDDSFVHDAKRARHTAAHCSPFRPQMGTVAANLPSSSNFVQVSSKVRFETTYSLDFLNSLILEQHEQYIQFAAEQLSARSKETTAEDFSYLS